MLYPSPCLFYCLVLTSQQNAISDGFTYMILTQYPLQNERMDLFSIWKTDAYPPATEQVAIRGDFNAKIEQISQPTQASLETIVWLQETPPIKSQKIKEEIC